MSPSTVREREDNPPGADRLVPNTPSRHAPVAEPTYTGYRLVSEWMMPVPFFPGLFPRPDLCGATGTRVGSVRAGDQ
ncbi:MAG TPA: hypothetical protein PLF81_08410 [Candidatus Anammoximicrobium sp.]|nr:hypothetical protein [Candidatus Anammoximicrobium sp.]